MKGFVKWFDAKKGFGFIAKSDGSGDIFVHHSGIRSQGFRTLTENDPVEFQEVVGRDNRLKAVNVVVVSQK